MVGKRAFPSVFQYEHAADFLMGLLRHIQNSNSRYSLRTWTKKLGVSDSGSLSRILQKKRAIPRELVKRIAEVYELSSAELSYFRMLTAFPDGLDPPLAAQLKILLRRPADLESVHSVSSDQLEGESSWVWPVLFCLDALRSAPRTKAEFLRHFPRSAHREVRLALRRMKQLGILREEKGRIVRGAENVVVPPSEEKNIRQFHHSMILNALETVHSISPERRHLGATTIALKIRDLPRLFRIVDRFHAELMELGRSEGADSIYHFSTQFFPLLVDVKSVEP